MIKGYANAGFRTIRVPVAWSNLMGENYKVSDDYIARVRQICEWILKYDMYCIINLHYDNGWINKFPENKTECMKKYKSIWTQVSTAFKDYGDKLIFESQNEELGWSSLWNEYSGSTAGKAESFALANEVNQAFVDTVRSTGGNNDKRHLLISGYNTAITHTADPLFKMPKDPAGRCAVSVHYYTPSTFAILEEDADWGKNRTTWGDASDINELNDNFNTLKTAFIDKGIPVIIGEYGCPKKNKDSASVLKYLTSVAKAAHDIGAVPVLWDTPGGRYDRNKCVMSDSKLEEGLREIYKDFKPLTDTQTEQDTNTKEEEQTQETIEKPAKAVISSVKNKSAKAVKLVIATQEATGFQIQIATDKAFTKNKKTYTTSKTAYTIKKLTKGKTYYIRVRAYNKNGIEGLYGAFSAIKKVRIKI